MGEVSFAAVLHWVTRIDDFAKLLADTCERERVLHLQRNEECAHSFLNWRSAKSDHPAVRDARAHISDHACHLFAKQLRLVRCVCIQHSLFLLLANIAFLCACVTQLPLYSAIRKEDEGFVRVWHITRENARGVSTFRRVIWASGFMFPACDCNTHTCSGIPCVHMLLILHKENITLFDMRLFHVHWTRRTVVRCANALGTPIAYTSCSTLPDTAGPVDNAQTYTSPTPTPIMQFVMQAANRSSDSYTLQCNTPNSDMGSPAPNQARPSDKVTTGKLMALSNSLIDLVTRPAAKNKGLDQKLYDVLKNIRNELVRSSGDDGNSDELNFNSPHPSTNRTLFEVNSSQQMEVIRAPTHKGGAPQQLRKKKRHEPLPMRATLDDKQFQVGITSSQVTEVARSRSRHPPQSETLCRFCGAAGCNRRRCPKVSRFGARCVHGQTFFNTVQQLLSTPILFDTIPVMEGQNHGPILSVDENWKTGKEFRHIVLKTWLRSSMPEQSEKLFLCIRRVKKNLLWLDNEDVGVVVNAQELYEKYTKFKLARKTLSKLIAVRGLYITGN